MGIWDSGFGNVGNVGNSIIGYLPPLLMDLSISAVHTGTAFYISKLGSTSTAWGIIIALKGLIYVLFSIPFGRASDKFGRGRILFASCLLTGFIYTLIPQCQTAVQVMLLFPLLGIPQAMFWPVFEAWLTEKGESGSLIKRLMMFNIFWSLGTTAGPFVAGHVAEVELFAPFYVSAIVVFTNTFIVMSQTKKSNKNSFDRPILHVSGELSPAPDWSRRYRYMAWIANFSAWFTLGVLRYLTPKLMVESGSSTGHFGNLMFVLGASQTLMFLGLGLKRASKWHYKFSPILMFQLLGFGSFMGLWLSQNSALWFICFAMVGSVISMSYFSSMYYSLHGQLDVGNKSGIHEMILGVGVLSGPFFGGIVADLFGAKMPYLFCALLILASLIAQVGLKPKSKV